MAALFFDNHSVIVYRQKRVGSTNRHTMSATGTVYAADITPAEPARDFYDNQATGKTYTCYLEVTTDVKVGDELVISDTTTLNSKRFAVKGVSHWEGFGAVDCKEVTIVARD